MSSSKQEFKKAVQIGIICVFSYTASYYMRHLLSVSTPSMLETGNFTKEYVGILSSVYFLIYALGQLINGVIGDSVKPKLMVFCGLCTCGLVSVLFTFTNVFALQLLCFALMGFALSMLRGPLVKTISENTLPTYARTCCVFLSFSSFIGPFVASMLSIMFNWKMTFIVAGISSIAIGFCAFGVLTLLERKGIITYTAASKSHGLGNIFKVFRLQNFMFYMLIGALVEISAASIGFWTPTYLSERLGFTTKASGIIFSAMSFVRAFTPFIALKLFKLFKENDIRMAKYACLLSAVLFMLLIAVTNSYINVILLLLALMSISCASTLLWSIYIPSQGKSGMVSTLNGVLDFSGYAIASVANTVFAFAMNTVGWNGIIVMWSLLMLMGAAASIFVKSNTNSSV